MRAFLAIVSAAVLLPVSGAQLLLAQSGEQPLLRGLAGVVLVVEEINQAAAEQCQLSRQSLEALLRRRLDSSRLRVVTPSDDWVPVSERGVLALSVNAGVLAGVCVSNLQLSVSRVVALPAGMDRGVATIWHTASLLSGPRNGFNDYLRGRVDEAFDSFLSAWIIANPKP